jgi:arylsulfatase A-like enzyme
MQAWAAAEYLDAVVGRVLGRLAGSRLAANTYVLLSSDNGPQLLPGEETPSAKLVSTAGSALNS